MKGTVPVALKTMWHYDNPMVNLKFGGNSEQMRDLQKYFLV
jgi:hypothetical protein